MLGVQASGEVHKLNYLRSLDDERDYTSYRGALRGFYRMSPLINLYVQGYANRPDFRQAADDAGVNRDASTFGGPVGGEFAPGGQQIGRPSCRESVCREVSVMDVTVSFNKHTRDCET